LNAHFREGDGHGGTLNENAELSGAPGDLKEVSVEVNGLATKDAVTGNVDVTFADITNFSGQPFAFGSGIECKGPWEGSEIACGCVLRVLIVFHGLQKRLTIARMDWPTLIRVIMVLKAGVLKWLLSVGRSIG
jgi:hypothetical protein